MSAISIHALLCDNRFKDYIIILNVCHYAYTSSIVCNSSLCCDNCVVFQNIIYIDCVCTELSLHPECFLRKVSTFVLFVFQYNQSLVHLQVVQNIAWNFFVLISSNFSSSTTMNLFSSHSGSKSRLQSQLSSLSCSVLKE